LGDLPRQFAADAPVSACGRTLVAARQHLDVVCVAAGTTTMALLQEQGEHYSQTRSHSQSFPVSDTLLLVTQAVDLDGMTPAALLTDLQRSNLLACQQSLYRPKRAVNRSSIACRRTSFDWEDEQDELDVLRQGMEYLSISLCCAVACPVDRTVSTMGIHIAVGTSKSNVLVAKKPVQMVSEITYQHPMNTFHYGHSL
jgi:hypothetical protein